jgi:hypothetical protein
MLIQLETQYATPKPRSVFYSYSQKDEDLRNELDTHLKLLKRDGFISTWHDRKIPPGDDWDRVINEHLNTADVILFLVSPHFLASEYCRDIEIRRAMERYDKHEAIVIPIILKPCVWTSESFAKLQVLPRNCRPLVEWRDTGFARVSEELRTMLVDLIYPRLPGKTNEGQHGHWIMKLRGRPGVDSRTRAQQVVSHLREFTEDFSITLLATSTTQVADGEKIHLGLLLILSGTPEAFSQISTAHQEGRLADAVDKDIASFYVINGATVHGSSTLGASVDVSTIEDENLVLRPGRKVEEAHLIALTFPDNETEGWAFTIDNGDSAFADEDSKRSDYQRLSDYFYTSLALKNEFLWVNLSAYESDRMLPSELSGTEMGRNLLSQDCMLKRLTASFMHPDSPIGREYWDAVYTEARRLFGTSGLPFRSFQKVWVTATASNVYVGRRGDPYLGELLNQYPPDSTTAFLITRRFLDVHCEEDIVAKQHAGGAVCATGDDDFALNVFRKIVLPKLKEEVNEGEHFSELRRLYGAEILATWLKKELKTEQQAIKNERLRTLLNSVVNNGDTTRKLVIGSIGALGGGKTPSLTRDVKGKGETKPVEHATPNAAAFKVPENVEFYSQYIRLFKDGVFRCARSEAGDTPEERVIRVYFSGAIDFRNLSDVISCVRM